MTHRLLLGFSLLLTALPAAAQEQMPIAYEEEIHGELTESDGFDSGAFYDEYTFEARAGDQIDIRMTSDEFDAYLELFDAAVTTLLDSDDDGLNPYIRFVIPEDATYLISATSVDSSQSGAYQLHLSRTATGLLPATPDPTFSSLAAGAREIAYGQTLNSALEETDPREQPFFNREEFYFEGAAGDEIEIRANSDNMDPNVYLYPPEGMAWGELTSNDDGGGDRNALLTYTLPSAGRYLIVVSSYEYGTYDLVLNRVSNGAAPTPSSAISAQPIVSNRTVMGSLADGDPLTMGKYYDAYVFTGRVGDRITISNVGDSLDTYLYVTQAGNLDAPLISDDDSAGDLDALIQYTLPADGDYWIIATSAYENAFGAYTLRLEKMAASVPVNAAPGTIAFGQSVEGSLTDTDPVSASGARYDAYTFTAATGEGFHILMRAAAMDSYLELYRAEDVNGVPIASNDDGGGESDALLSFTPKVAGTYIIHASGYAADTRGDYTLALNRQ